MFQANRQHSLTRSKSNRTQRLKKWIQYGVTFGLSYYTITLGVSINKTVSHFGKGDRKVEESQCV